MSDNDAVKAAKDDAAAKAAAAKAAKASKDEVAAAPELAQVVPLGENRWRLKEHQNPGHWVCVPAGTSPEDLLQPSFWANVARHLRPQTTVEVHTDDASWYGEVYVLSAGRNWASVSLLRAHKLDKPHLPQMASQYGIAFNGPVDKFRITRLSDQAVIQAGFDSETLARRALDEYLRKLAA